MSKEDVGLLDIGDLCHETFLSTRNNGRIRIVGVVVVAGGGGGGIVGQGQGRGRGESFAINRNSS